MRPPRAVFVGEVLAYTVSGDVAPGEHVVVTAALRPGVSGYAVAAGAPTTFEHTFAGVGADVCGEVKGEQVKGGKPNQGQEPERAPVVLGSQAAVPSAVDAGLGSLPTATDPASQLGRTLTAGGIALMLAAGWLFLGRRERGAREV